MNKDFITFELPRLPALVPIPRIHYMAIDVITQPGIEL